MKNILCILLLLSFSIVLSAQTPAAIAQRAEMKKLEWLVGSWKGTGWVHLGTLGRKELMQTEIIQTKLEGMLLVIEGRAVSTQDGSTVNDALAFVSYDERTKVFHWRAFTKEGRLTDAEAKVSANKLQWEFKSSEIAGRWRYTIKRSENGELLELAEGTDDGHTWHKMLEITLRRLEERAK